MAKKQDIVGDIIAFETGELDRQGIINLFQELVNTGQAWQLQGNYGRTATALLKNGLIKPAPVRSS